MKKQASKQTNKQVQASKYSFIHSFIGKSNERERKKSLNFSFLSPNQVNTKLNNNKRTRRKEKSFVRIIMFCSLSIAPIFFLEK